MSEKSLDSLIRYGAFSVLHAVRRTGFLEQVREVARVNTDRGFGREFRSRALDSLLMSAWGTRNYGHLRNVAELSEYPVLNKSTIKSDPDAFLSDSVSSADLVTVSTSGSYGVPLTMRLSKEKKQRQHAEVVYFGSWANYQVGDRHLYLRGWNHKGPLKMWLQNEWFASTDSPTPRWLDDQVELIRKKGLSSIIGIPSVVALIAQHASARGLGPADFSVRGVITSGESLRDEQRAAVRAAFGSSCLSRYSAEEVGTVGAECAEENVMHVNEASFIVEVLALDHDVPAAQGELGRIVVTDLFSHAMPLIRYELGDLGILGSDCACGRPTATLRRLEGRTVEMIEDIDGNRISPFFINPIMKGVTGVKQFQFAQTDADSYELRIVGDYSVGLQSAHEALTKALGVGSRVNLRLVDQIPKLASGKRPYVLNEWKSRVRGSGQPDEQ